MARQIALEFKRQREFDDEFLGDAAELVLDALHREAPFVAFGPAISVDLENGVVSVECTITAETDDDAERAVGHLNEIIFAALAAADYESSVTQEPVPA